MYYYLSVGSNVNPEQNIAACLETLLDNFESAYVFPCVYTVPENIVTDKMFINTLLVVESSVSKDELKRFFCSVEEALGRDRSDQNSSLKDRACDIDIVKCSDQFCLDCFSECEERYLQDVLSENSEKVTIKLFGLNFSDRPASIYLDTASSDKLVIQYKSYPLNNGVEPGFAGQ